MKQLLYFLAPPCAAVAAHFALRGRAPADVVNGAVLFVLFAAYYPYQVSVERRRSLRPEWYRRPKFWHYCLATLTALAAVALLSFMSRLTP